MVLCQTWLKTLDEHRSFTTQAAEQGMTSAITRLFKFIWCKWSYPSVTVVKPQIYDSTSCFNVTLPLIKIWLGSRDHSPFEAKT